MLQGTYASVLPVSHVTSKCYKLEAEVHFLYTSASKVYKGEEKQTLCLIKQLEWEWFYLALETDNNN